MGCLLFDWGGCGGRGLCCLAEGAPSASAGLMASGLWPAVNCSRRGGTLAVLCACVNPGLLAELVQSKLECSEKPFRCCSVLQLRAVMPKTACCCLPPHFIPKFLCCWGFICMQGGQWHLDVCGRWGSSVWSKWMEQGSCWDTRGDTLLLVQTIPRAVGCSRAAYTWGFGSRVWPAPAFLGQQNEAMWCWEPHFGAAGNAAQRALLCPLAAEDPWRGKEQAKGPLKVKQ